MHIARNLSSVLTKMILRGKNLLIFLCFGREVVEILGFSLRRLGFNGLRRLEFSLFVNIYLFKFMSC